MRLMAAVKKAAKKAAKKVAKAVTQPEKFSPEWYALKEEARKALDARQ